MDPQTKKRRWFGAGGVALAASAAFMLTSLGGSASAADTPPTLTQLQAAHDQIASANATIQAYIDASQPTTTPVDPSKPGLTATRSSDCTSIALTWTDPPAGAPANYDYTRDGVDNTGFGAFTSDPLPPTTHTATLDKLVAANAYHVGVDALNAAGTATGSASATVPVCIPATASPTPTPSATATTTAPTPTPTATGGSGSTRLSRLAWSSGVWADQDPAQAASFTGGPRGGVALDNYLVYASRGSVAAENNPGEWRSGLPSNFNGVTQDLVLGLTTWTGDGAFMTQAQGAQIGTSLCSVDGTAPIVRLDWEMNLQDGAGSNGAELTSANRSAWQTRFIAVANGIHSTCAGARIDFNPNHGGDQTPGCSGAGASSCTRLAFQAVKQVVAIYSVDTYDSFPPVKADNSGWNNRLTGGNELEDARAYAGTNGKQFGVPEWGLFCSGTSGCAINNGTDGGNDDPNYVHQMVAYFNAHACTATVTVGCLAYETYFNETAAYINSDLIGHNPNSRAQYRSDLLALQAAA